MRLVAVLLAVMCALVAACTPSEAPESPESTVTPSPSAPATADESGASEPSTHQVVIEHGGQQREAIVEVPAHGSAPLAALIVMHGYGGSAAGMAAIGLTAAGHAEGMVVVYPQGWESSWNAGACCGPSADGLVDDVGYLSALIDTLVSEYGVEPGRIHLAGFSNGGMMAHRFACEQPGKVASISSVGGALGTPDCLPTESVSVMILHSRNDTVVPVDGGRTQGLSGEWLCAGVESDAEQWAGFNQCRPPSDELSSAGLLSRDWLDCAGGAQVRLRISSDGGHDWPLGGDAQLDATAEIIAFATQRPQ